MPGSTAPLASPLSQGPPAPTAAVGTPVSAAPPSVMSTARRRSAEGEGGAAINSAGAAAAAAPGSTSPRSIAWDTPASSRRPHRLGHSTLTHSFPSAHHHAQQPQHRKRSSLALSPSALTSPLTPEAVRQRLRNTLVIAEAEAVRAARDFSLEMYRGLHHRDFKSVHEELDYLRRDFVASRNTLALLHEDNVRLERELLLRVAELHELQSKLEEAQREVEEGQSRSSSSHPVRTSHRASLQLSNRGSRSGSAAEESSMHGVTALWAVAAEQAAPAPFVVVEESTPHIVSNDASEPAGADEKTVEGQKRAPVASSSRTASASAVEAGPPHTATKATPPATSTPLAASSSLPSSQRRSTSLSLFVPMKPLQQQQKPSRAGDASDLHELVRDLRANLARRDTSLNEVQMEHTALRHELNERTAELHTAHEALQKAMRERDAAQQELTAQAAEQTEQAAQLENLRRQVQQLTKEKDSMQARLTTAELLYEHTGPKDAPSGEGGSDGAAPTQDHHLRDQLSLYRAKWQAAEDEVEHLNARLSELQRQLVLGRVREDARGDASNSETTLPAATAGDSSGSGSGSDRAAVREALEQQRAEHAVELASQHRQHQEQLQLHAEEIQRLQRRLDRAQENAAFHEDQLRQQRQEDARLHRSEVHTLQTQLRTAQGELTKAQQDREHLARQLRRSTEQETTVEVLRGQVEQLKQRLGEVGAEAAQVRGREKEATLQVQRERMARVTAEHTAETAEDALQRAQKEAEYLREELKLVREQLGVREVSCQSASPSFPSGAVAPPATITTSQALAPGSTAPEHVQMRALLPASADAADAAALASEIKGYVSLMRVNATLQQRIAELELHVIALQQRPPAGEAGVAAPPATQCASPVGPGPLPTSAAPAAPAPFAASSSPPPADAARHSSEAAQLREDLTKALRHQQSLLTSWTEMEKEHRQLAEDNATLAAGVEVLEKQLRAYQDAVAAAAKARHVRERARSAKHRSEKRRSARTTSSHTPLHVTVLDPMQSPHAPEAVKQSEKGSRVRQRIHSARVQDQALSWDAESGKGAEPSAPVSALLPRGPAPFCCGGSACVAVPPPMSCCRHHDTSATPAAAPLAAPPPSALSSSTTPTTTSQAEVAPTALAAPPYQPQTLAEPSLPAASPGLVVEGPPPVPPTGGIEPRRDAASSPLLSPRRCVHGSMLPPVFYPPLIARGGG